MSYITPDIEQRLDDANAALERELEHLERACLPDSPLTLVMREIGRGRGFRDELLAHLWRFEFEDTAGTLEDCLTLYRDEGLIKKVSQNKRTKWVLTVRGRELKFGK
jgi:hypothetical protein